MSAAVAPHSGTGLRAWETAGAATQSPRRPTPERRRGGARRPAVALFAVAFVAYASVGVKVVVLQHVVVADGWARLAHAYFVFYNAPPKLAAIGFVWPPLMTMAFLPLAWVKPLATSLVALPLMSATFAAGVVVVLDRVLALANMRPALRYPLLAAFALNPMVLFYATNGMAEMVSLLLLTTALYALLAWYLQRRARQLVLLSLALTAGFLSRYELILWTAPAAAVVFSTLLRERAGRAQLEGWAVAFFSPIAYGIGVWMFANWTIMGSPLYWLHAETSSEIGVNVNAAMHPPLASVLGHVATLNASVYAPTVLALVVVGIVLAVRRDVMTAGLVAFLALNAVFSAALFYKSGNLQYLELRYNIRPIPMVLVAVAWLYLIAGSKRRRTAIWVLSLLVLVASYPLTWHTMATSKGGFLEDAFLKALPTTRDQTDATGHVLGSAVKLGVRSEQDMAAYIRHHVSGPNAVLTDDAASFAVMLYDGRPGVYWDRIDKGDATWRRVLDRPWGRVRYLLVSPRSVAGGSDLALQRYPKLLRGGVPGFARVYGNERYLLFRVVAARPAPERSP